MRSFRKTTPIPYTPPGPPRPPAGGTCDASMANETAFFGPCILRHQHDGPVHQDTEGKKWAKTDEALLGDDGRPVCTCTLDKPCPRCEVARLHEGEEPYVHEHTVATPGQWIWHWNRATPEQRLDMAARIKDAFARSSQCFMGGHEMRLDQQQARITRLEAEREQARRDVESSTEAAHRAMEQRQEMADERYALQERGDKAEAAIAELAQAIRLTREYVGEEVLPAVEGWSWYDALRRHAPHELASEHADQPATEEQPDA